MRTRRPTHLTDSQLIDELKRCARSERGATARLVAHLAEMDARQLHLAAGFSSLFAYCCEVLQLAESATYKRIEVARAARRYPAILDLLADGALSLSTARLLAPHLTGEDHRQLLADAAGLGKRAVEELVARRFPRPDVATLVRKLPAAPPTVTKTPDAIASPQGSASASQLDATPLSADTADPVSAASLGHGVHSSAPRPLATPLSADRYQIRFTASAATWKKLRVAQELLRHAVPSGDPAEIVDRALTALIEDLARKKCAAVTAPTGRERTTAVSSRHIPAMVRRAVWVRDRGCCTFVAKSGRRCQERALLEFHHVKPYAAGGAATIANIQLRCRAHNAFEAVLFYGSSKASCWKVDSTSTRSPGLSEDHSTGPGASRVAAGGADRSSSP
jgi:hypothetical protein